MQNGELASIQYYIHYKKMESQHRTTVRSNYVIREWVIILRTVAVCLLTNPPMWDHPKSRDASIAYQHLVNYQYAVELRLRKSIPQP